VKAICGLGNPGRDYERHRHNVGFMVVDALCRRAGASLTQEKFQGRLGQGILAGEKLLFLEPQTYMNESGRCLVAATQFYKLGPADVLVIHDELDLPFGKLQLKAGGGTGGHNGLKSIAGLWGTEQFDRLRFGIGKPGGGGTGPGGSTEGETARGSVVGHVLSAFAKGELPELEALIEKAADAAALWVAHGMQTAMNRFNRKT
jgi:peptidyl-tRNA hydrolase, PTH1 family